MPTLSRALSITFLFAAISLSLAAIPAAAQTASAPPAALDATLFTTYTIASGYQNLSLIVCGSTAESEGCYGSASLGPFGKAGALLESTPTTKGSTVTRFIYVVDSAAGTSGTAVNLVVYKKTDTISSSSDTVSVTLFKTISLPLTGGSTAVTSMAANTKFLFIGTDQGQQAVMVQKSNLAVTKVGIYIIGPNVTGITADQYGYVTVTQGDFTTFPNGFTVFGPTGAEQEDGGGADFMLSTTAGVSTANLPPSNVDPSERLGVKPKAANQ
jgi:hypothetical protein